MIKFYRFSRQIFILGAVFLVTTGLLYAATTVGTDIVTTGDLSIQGTATTTDLVVSNTFTLGEVVLLKADGVREVFQAAADTDLARGVALTDALASASASSTVYLGPVVFEPAATLVLPAGVSLVGSGSALTTIKTSDFQFLLDVRGNNNVSDLYLENNNTPQGTGVTASAGEAINVYFSDCRIRGYYDGVLAVTDDNSNWIFDNCYFDHPQDDGINSKIENLVIKNSVFRAASTYPSGENSFVVVGGGTAHVTNNQVENVRVSGTGATPSFIRGYGSGTMIYSANNVVEITDQTGNAAQGFVVSTVTTGLVTFYSYNDVIDLSSSGDKHHFKDQASFGGSGVFNYLGGNLTLFSGSGGVVNKIQQSDILTGSLTASTSATTTIAINSSSLTQGACLKLKDVDGDGYTYVTANNGVLTASATSCE
jgi:hypothetical protein